jgi:hypothetical protein
MPFAYDARMREVFVYRFDALPIAAKGPALEGWEWIAALLSVFLLLC